MMILGFDQAPRNIGFCYGDSQATRAPTFGVREFDSFGEKSQMMIAAISKWMRGLLKTVIPEVIYYENFFNNGNNNTFRDQAIVAAIVEFLAFESGAGCYCVESRDWRKRALGAHNKPKWAPCDQDDWLKEAAKIACAERNWLIENHNTAEAALIWDYGCAHSDISYRAATKPRVQRVLLERENADRAFNAK